MLTVYNDRCDDLLEAEAQYHRKCNMASSYTAIQSQRGRPVNLAKLDAFNKAGEWLKTTEATYLH